MTDRQLLEMAAKAAGLHHSGWDEEDQAITAWFDNPLDTFEGGAWGDWNPLEDDAQALRLAVDLRISVTMSEHGRVVCRAKEWTRSIEPYGDDARAATRLAIVKAAAEIAAASVNR